MTFRRVTSPGLGHWSGLLLALGILVQGSTARADSAATAASRLPAVFGKAIPENKKDLKDIELHIKGLLKKTMPATVGVLVNAAP